jgi:hypothetical protein
MELLLERIRKEREYTVGRLSLLKRTDNGTMQQVQKTYICDTLESPWRDVGNGDNYRFHDTAVLAGRYPVVINRHPENGQWLPMLVGVPKCRRAFLPEGSAARETRGDILTGYLDKDDRLTDSKFFTRLIKDAVSRTLRQDIPVFITVK